MSRKEGNKILNFGDPGSSFYQLLYGQYPHLFPSPMRPGSPGVFLTPLTGPAGLAASAAGVPTAGGVPLLGTMVPHGTTVLALRYREGVVVAGDRMATEGYSVSERRIEKVHPVDGSSVIAIAGAAGPCMEMVRLLRVELEHYEKLEGLKLSMEGKASKLAAMIKGNLPMAMQGLVVIPIFAGYDKKREIARVYKYDIAGGQYEEEEYYSIGSGGKDARGSLKKIFKKDLPREEAIAVAIEALYDASEGDIATGGPDWIRGIFPTIKIIDKDGVCSLSDEETKTKLEQLIARQGG